MACPVQPWGGLIIGLISGVVYVFSSKLVSNVLKVDDPLDAAAVHGFCGAWGLIAAALFAAKEPTLLAYGSDEYYGVLPRFRCGHESNDALWPVTQLPLRSVNRYMVHLVDVVRTAVLMVSCAN